MPASVGATPALLRVSSDCPARSSSLRICSLTDDCDKNTRGAAAVRLPASITAARVRSCSRSKVCMVRPSVYPMDSIISSAFPMFEEFPQ